jgi:hypothetical protein
MTCRFRLCHWIGLVAVVFLLALGVAWQQVSIHRLGYLVEETERRRDHMKNELQWQLAEVQEAASPLLIAELLDGLAPR